MKNTPVIALAGNPNSGKTTLFNLLTKSGEATGNRAGVTVSAKTAPLKAGNYRADITDLPGTYSLSPYGDEEKAAERFIKSGAADVVIDVADATNLERSLFLATELAERHSKVILALNMMDEAEHEGIKIDAGLLSGRLGIPVVPISAAKNIGIEALIDAARNAVPGAARFTFSGGEERSRFCRRLATEVTHGETAKVPFSDRVDRIICKKYIGLPLFFAVVFLMFAVTFSGAVKALSELLVSLSDRLSEAVSAWLSSMGAGAFTVGLISEGLIKGTGAVLSFLPQTAALFFMLELLEDSGYMARAAYVSDGLLRSAGLSGKAFIPFLMGFGCTVPAVMATETLDPAERRSVIFSLPFIPCSARLPVFTMIIGTFFPDHSAVAAFLIYFLGILTAYISSLIYSKSKKGRAAPPLTVELPKYRLPTLKNLATAIKHKLFAFISRAGTVVMLCSVAVHLLCSLDGHLRLTADPSKSLMALAGGLIAPLLSPLGIGDWRIAASLISGFFAKETIVSSLSVMCPDGLSHLIGAADAVALCVFVLLYSPCAATVSAQRQYLGRKNSLFLIVRCIVFAYLAALIARAALRFFVGFA